MSSVFSRLTGRRHPNGAHLLGQQEKGHATDLSLPLDVHRAGSEERANTSDGRSSSKQLLPNGHHRRESSILSLTTSVTDLGSSVKRSVSLRSHRTNFSGSGGSVGSTLGHKSRSPPSSGSNLFSPLSASPDLIETSADTQTPLLPPGPPPPIPTSASPFAPRHTLKKSLSQKFKTIPSSDTIRTTIAGSTPPLDGDTLKSPVPRAGSDQPRSPFPSMLVASPSAPGKRPSERPNLATQPSIQSFSRDTVSSHGGNQNTGAARDAHSTHGNTGTTAPLRDTLTASGVAGNHNPNVVFQQIQDTSAKRMATIDYMRRVHEGDVFYFSTLHYSPASLSTMPSLYPHKLARRAASYFVLGYSLPALLDLNASSPMEYLKTLSALLAEFETYQTLTGFDSSGATISRGRMGAMLKSGMGLGARSGKIRRSSTVGGGDHTSTSGGGGQFEQLGLPQSSHSNAPSPVDSIPSPIGHDFTHLLTPQLPFDPDFGTTFATLCDTLIDCYGKLIDLVPGPEVCGPGVGEAFGKADKAIRKILVANVVREFEDTTRTVVRQEVAGLGKLVLNGLM